MGFSIKVNITLSWSVGIATEIFLFLFIDSVILVAVGGFPIFFITESDICLYSKEFSIGKEMLNKVTISFKISKRNERFFSLSETPLALIIPVIVFLF